MSDAKLNELFDRALGKIGKNRLAEELEKLASLGVDEDEDTLTIVANAGVHHLPSRLLRGDVFYASEGSLDFSSQESAKQEFIRIVDRVARKLKERNWKKIYLIPFGPTNLSMLIKLLVYRVTHIETVDIFHVGNGEYHEIDIRLRPLVVEANRFNNTNTDNKT